MNQAEVSKLVSQLRTKVNPRLRKFRSPGGPEARLDKLRKTVTALVKHERLELNYPRADESRMYAERVIIDRPLLTPNLVLTVAANIRRY
jgi:large subunit ribosomal protein L17